MSDKLYTCKRIYMYNYIPAYCFPCTVQHTINAIHLYLRWLLFSILLAVLWFVLVIPLSIAALLDAVKKIEEDKAPLIPSCEYSVPLLLVVILTQVLAAAFIIYWFSKCCKCARSRKASRMATSMTAVVAVIYGVVIVAFAVSVFIFVNKTTNEDSKDPTLSTPNSNQGDVCIPSSSPPVLYAAFYLFALLVFLVLGVLMTCCDYHYKKVHSNFLRYLQDMVQIYENEGADEGRDEETAL